MASTTITNPKWTRWTRLGTSGPQPKAGTPFRAAEAYANMAAAAWVAGGPPAIPPHDFDAASPAPGDAFRQTWGYDADARTERSACGAACYSFRLPADALSGTPANVISVSVRCSGDRWLECGAILTAVLSGAAEPPAWDALLADGVSTAAFLVPDAETAGGEAIHPNDRADQSATVPVSFPTGTAAAAYLHLCIRVADYLPVRGAWHEGGAMLDPATAAVTFSRDVEPDAAAPVAWTSPERPDGDGALSRTGAIAASLTWPTGLFAGLDGEALWGAVSDLDLIPCAEDPDVPFNAHRCSRIGRWPDASGRDASGDWAFVGAVAETWSGVDFPWVCGVLYGARFAPGRYRALELGQVPAAALSVRVAVYVAEGLPPVAEGCWRRAVPDAAQLDWAALRDGSLAELPFAGGAVPLARAARIAVDLSAGWSGAVPAAISLDARATVVVTAAPLELSGFAAARWPVGRMAPVR